MRRVMVPALLAFAALWISGARAQAPEEAKHDEVQILEDRPYRAPDEKVPDLNAVTSALVEKTNAFRVEQKCSPVKPTPKLMETARDFAGYMAQTNRYGHTADGNDPGKRAGAHGYEYGLISENIAYAFNSAGYSAEALSKQLVEGWENSPGHRKNMLDPDVTETGMAVARSEKTGFYFAVQLFARPKSLAVTFEVVNQSKRTITYRAADQSYSLQTRYRQLHELGRPVEVTFEIPPPKGADSKTSATTQTFKVESKARFLVTDAQGTIQVQLQKESNTSDRPL